MNRLAFASLIVPVMLAQDASSIRIFTEPSGVEYFVDGRRYNQPTSFLWPKGSKHVVYIGNPIINRAPTGICEQAEATPIQYDPNCTTRYAFSGWESNAGSVGSDATTHVITADPGITFLKGNFSVQYRVNIATYNRPGPDAPDTCDANAAVGPSPPGGGPGIVFIGANCVRYAVSLWLSPGDYAVQAIPYEGYVFRGWNLDNGVTTPYVNSIKVGGPTTIHPLFEPAKRIRLYTEPYGLQLRVDRTIIPTIDPRYHVPKITTPGYFDWARNSTHILGAVSPQTDLDGRTWVFDSWSNGGGQDMVYTAGDDVNVITQLTAKFARGVTGSIMTAPGTLKVKVDGQDNVPYTFAWKVGSKVTLSAPTEQMDPSGRKYTFKGWSNGAPATHQITVEEAHIQSGIRLTAVYEALPQVIVRTAIPGATIKVDGVDCASPCKLDRAPGTTVRLSVPAVVPQSDISRFDFTGWSDGATAERTVTFDRDTQTLIAGYRRANRLVAILDPPDAAVVHTEPASVDGFYPEGSSVRVTLETKKGFRFRRWEGDLTGTFPSGDVVMSGSRMVQASFDRVPFVSESGVRNAAGITPETGVAAGSLISIFGASLSDRLEASTGNPLAQTLAGTVVFVEDRILPLIYVSPEQINAQLPSDLQPGNYTLIVRPERSPEVKTQFTVVRNAPGLFANAVDSISWAVALHEDGSPVTSSNPAKLDETITLTGTGFGPYDRRTVDGFAVAPSPAIHLADYMEVRAGDLMLRPEWCGALPGMVGVGGARLKLSGVPSGRHEVRVVVNGVESNTVVLAVE